MNEHAKKENLTRFGLMALRHWEEHLPRMYKSLKEAGTLIQKRLRGPGEDEGSGGASTRQGDAEAQRDSDARGRGTGSGRVDTDSGRKRPGVKGEDFAAPLLALRTRSKRAVRKPSIARTWLPFLS